VLQRGACGLGTGLATGEIVSFGSRVTTVAVNTLRSEEKLPRSLAMRTSMSVQTHGRYSSKLNPMILTPAHPSTELLPPSVPIIAPKHQSISAGFECLRTTYPAPSQTVVVAEMLEDVCELDDLACGADVWHAPRPSMATMSRGITQFAIVEQRRLACTRCNLHQRANKGQVRRFHRLCLQPKRPSDGALGSGLRSGTRAATSRWKWRARSGPSMLLGVWKKT
jgi:hypothetical protein